MAIHRGIQSVIFYYLSCAPYTGYANRKKRRKQAVYDRADKQALEDDMPGLYRHPSPFTTNPHWQTEIELGPGPPSKRKKGERTGQDTQWALTSQATNSSGDVGSKTTSDGSSGAVERGGGLAAESRNDSKLNFRRHQRVDEELWGTGDTTTVLREAGVSDKDGSTSVNDIISRPPIARIAHADRVASSYYAVQNPPINDNHPAIVTRMASREDAMWMLQPPPPVRVMQGKEEANRSRSNSGGSRLSSRKDGDTNLSRQISARVMEEKLRNGELPTRELASRASSRKTLADATAGQRHDRDARPRAASRAAESSDSSSDEAPPPARRKRVAVQKDASEDSSTTIIHQPGSRYSATANTTTARKLSRTTLRPQQLASIPSWHGPGSAHDQRRQQQSPTSKSRPRSRTSTDSPDMLASQQQQQCLPLGKKDNSLNILQELVPDSASLLNIQPVLHGSRSGSKSPSSGARVLLSHSDAQEGDFVRTSGAGGDEADPSHERERSADSVWDGGAWDASWYDSKDFAFPQWAAERVTRHVSHRWSMDF